MIRTMRHHAVVLACFAFIATAAVAAVHFLTQDRIAEQQKLNRLTTLHQILPESAYDNDLYQSCVLLPTRTDASQKRPAYIAQKNGKLVALLIENETEAGYGGRIRFLIGIDHQGKITGVRTLSHHETPGLGDKIELSVSDWILSFNGKSLQHPESKNWAVRKDGGSFDQFTGATITPRAMVNAVHQTLQAFSPIDLKAIAAAQPCEAPHD